LICGVSPAQSTITTIAGSRYQSFQDGIPAINAPVGSVSGVTADKAGNVYFSDINSDKVFRVSTNGIITTYAGSGTAGYGGDGGPATSAALNNPRGLAFDAQGNLLICDGANNRIRKVNTSAMISTIAGNGTGGFAGDGGPAIAASIGGNTRIALDSQGNIYISDPANSRVRRITPDGMIHTFAGNGVYVFAGDGGPAAQASLQYPLGLAFDTAGNLFIADSQANRIRKVSPNGVISTYAGNGTGNESGDGGLATQAHLNSPSGLAFDSSGGLLIADQNGNQIRRVDPSTGLISTVAGTSFYGVGGDGGPAINAQLYSPADLFMTSSSVLLIADFANFRVRALTTKGNLITIAGNGNYGYSGDNGVATDANLSAPDGVAPDAAGNLNICDSFANRVRTVSQFGIISLTAGTGTPGFGGDGGPASSAMLVDCDGIATDSSGNIYVADTRNRRIRKINSAGTISTVAGNGTSGFAGDGGQAPSAELAAPQGVAVDSKGNLYIADTGNNRIRKVSSGIIATIAGNGLAGYSGGEGLPATTATLNAPSRVTVDSAGTVYFSDTGNNVVRSITTDGDIHTVAGNARAGFSGDGGPATFAMLNNPNGLAIDSTGGLLIADTGNLRIRRVDPVGGTISTIAGNGTNSVSGDGRPPLSTGFAYPVDVATDSLGNVYVADQNNMRVRRIQPAPSSLVLSETGMTFTAAVDGTSIAPIYLKILNGGAGTIGWSISTTVLSGSANWLFVSPSQGTSTSSSTSSFVQVAVNPAGLAPGNYYGKLQISSPGVANSPRFVTVVLRVLTAAQTTGANISPASFLFSAAVGGANPAAQLLTISQLHGSALNFTAVAGFPDTNKWLSVSPGSGSVAAGKPVVLTLQAKIAGLAARVYTATVVLTFSDGVVLNVPATLTVFSPLTAHAPNANCTATQLLPAVTGLGQNFNLPIGWPVPLEVTVSDDCGQPFINGAVTATFTNGDAPLPLTGLQDGTWAATWAPRKTSSSMTLTIAAQGTPATLKGSITVSGQLNPNAEPPIIATGGILNAASFSAGEPPAPGALMAIFGSSLASSTATATTLPLPTQLAGTEVIIGGVTMPLLYAGSGQINAMVPFTLSANTTQQLIIQAGTTLSVPESATVAPGAPGTFTVNGSGSGQAIVIAINADGTYYVVSTAQPAHPGSTIVIYCTGLGGVQSSIHAGESTPLTPLSPTSEAVTLTIGSTNVPVAYAGLVPTFSGLYQVNAVIPTGTALGDAVPLTLTTVGLTGPPVTIAIH